MVFSSLIFIFKFLPVFFVTYAICPDKWKNLCLLTGSLIFYFYGIKDHPLYMTLMVLSILVNYRLGIQLGQQRQRSGKGKWLSAGIIYNLFWLFLFKYSGFFAENLNTIFAWTGIRVSIPVINMALPVGISFYTFQAISYLADVYRRDVSYETSFINFGMYICMFPQLIAGPIVTYSSIRRQLAKRRPSMGKIENGLREFTIGLGYKVLLANQVSGLWGQVKTIGFESISTPLAWLGLAAFSFQIYFDFYGYSLMAKGLGQIMGFHLPDNFDHPYLAVSMTEFWRKWHMTLGSWFREYVYIPLGGNRKGKARYILNLAVVWLLTGFWHGASWNFILWGMILFLMLAAEKLGLDRVFHQLPVVGHAYMILAIPLTWLVFAVTDLSQVATYFQRLFPFLSPGRHFTYYSGDFLKYGKLYFISMSAGFLFMTRLPGHIYGRIKYSFVSAVFLLVIFWLCVYFMKMGADDPFLYFRF